VDSVVIIAIVLGLGLLLVCACGLLCWYKKEDEERHFVRTETDGQFIQEDQEKTGDGNVWPVSPISLSYFRYESGSEPSPLCSICLDG
jgi:hypothetical protein